MSVLVGPARLATMASVLLPLAALAVAGWLRRWVSEDGFINFRVVQNILDGYGPVFNLGERVEITTSVLWTYLLAATRFVVPVPVEWLAWSSVWPAPGQLGGAATVVPPQRSGGAPGLPGGRGPPAGVGLRHLGPGDGPLLLLARCFVLAPDPNPCHRAAAEGVPSALGAPGHGVRPRARPAGAARRRRVQRRLPGGADRARRGSVAPTDGPGGRGAGAAGAVSVAASVRGRAWGHVVLVAVPVATALLHGVYIVRVGGDCMHGRLLVPAVFALVMPFMVVTVTDLARVAGVALTLGWAVLSMSILRLPYERIGPRGIADERGHYVAAAGHGQPRDAAGLPGRRPGQRRQSRPPMGGRGPAGPRHHDRRPAGQPTDRPRPAVADDRGDRAHERRHRRRGGGRKGSTWSTSRAWGTRSAPASGWSGAAAPGTRSSSTEHGSCPLRRSGRPPALRHLGCSGRRGREGVGMRRPEHLAGGDPRSAHDQAIPRQRDRLAAAPPVPASRRPRARRSGALPCAPGGRERRPGAVRACGSQALREQPPARRRQRSGSGGTSSGSGRLGRTSTPTSARASSSRSPSESP
jgi:arabinofuranosyltransferase